MVLTNMAAGSSNSGNQQKLTVGSRVSCTTCNSEKVEGEVLAFDYHHKLLVLKLPSSSGDKGTCNINFLNLDWLTDFEIIEEIRKSPSQLPVLDMNKILYRTEQNLKQRQRQSERIGIGVSEMAQKLFEFVSKTYNCHWEANNIVVEAIEVKIVPPYKPDNLIGDAQAIDPIKKLIEKFLA